MNAHVQSVRDAQRRLRERAIALNKTSASAKTLALANRAHALANRGKAIKAALVRSDASGTAANKARAFKADANALIRQMRASSANEPSTPSLRGLGSARRRLLGLSTKRNNAYHRHASRIENMIARQSVRPQNWNDLVRASHAYLSHPTYRTHKAYASGYATALPDASLRRKSVNSMTPDEIAAAHKALSAGPRSPLPRESPSNSLTPNEIATLHARLSTLYRRPQAPTNTQKSEYDRLLNRAFAVPDSPPRYGPRTVGRMMQQQY